MVFLGFSLQHFGRFSIMMFAMEPVGVRKCFLTKVKIMFSRVITNNPIPQTVIKTLYRYYEQPQNPMTIGEMYLLLKLVLSKMEDEFEKMGIDIEKELAGTVDSFPQNDTEH